MRILLLSAYEADSHRHWRLQLEQGLPEHSWTHLTLPPRHFSWRLRGNALYWATEQRETLSAGYDLLLATSMVDLACLRGLSPALAAVPSILYFHENQFDYPANVRQQGQLEAQMVSIYSALAANQLVFNSNFNCDGFVAGVDHLLAKLPDFVPDGLGQVLREKSCVLPVPVSDATGSTQERAHGPLQIVWNHRWEYDKGPLALLELTEAMLAAPLDFTLHLVGRQFRDKPEELLEVEALLLGADRLGTCGYVDSRDEYEDLLRSCDVVLSTALHDFQGLSVIEACGAGCTPLLPNRLVYPEWFEADFLYDDVAGAVSALQRCAALKSSGEDLPTVDVSRFGPQRLLPEYEALFHSQCGHNCVS